MGPWVIVTITYFSGFPIHSVTIPDSE